MAIAWTPPLLTLWRGRIASQCAICRSWPSQPICESCVARFAPPVTRCRTCALAIPEGLARCAECVAHPPPLDACVAACHYAWPWPEHITQFKFNGSAGWAGPFAMLMRSAPWAEPALDEAQRVLPMPLAAGRLRERGFNQALELARRLAPKKVDARLLLRTRETTAQSGLARAERLKNLRGAFALEPMRAHLVRGENILLVDDVMTSGASLFTAAQVLRDAGAARVTAVVLARTESPDAR